MIDAKTILDIIKTHGYRSVQYEYVDGVLTSILSTLEGEETGIAMNISVPKSYLDELRSIPEGVEFDWDLSKVEVISMNIPGPYTTETGFVDGAEIGVVLAVNDDWHDHELTLENLKHAFEIQENPGEHLKFLLKQHIKHLDALLSKVQPILKKKGYKLLYDSITSVGDMEKDTSDLVLQYEGRYHVFTITTDCFDGSLKLGQETIKDLSVLTEDYLNKLIKDDD